VVLNGIPARVIGMLFLFLLLSVILLSYSLIYWEGNHAGRFNSSNIKARKTVLIHLVQISLHVVPTLIIIGLGKMCGVFFFALNLVLFSIFAFAQCFNPLVYGSRTESCGTDSRAGCAAVVEVTGWAAEGRFKQKLSHLEWVTPVLMCTPARVNDLPLLTPNCAWIGFWKYAEGIKFICLASKLFYCAHTELVSGKSFQCL
jgi:hypothetical protein